MEVQLRAQRAGSGTSLACNAQPVERFAVDRLRDGRLNSRAALITDGIRLHATTNYTEGTND